jgi:hypothetical protein
MPLRASSSSCRTMRCRGNTKPGSLAPSKTVLGQQTVGRADQGQEAVADQHHLTAAPPRCSVYHHVAGQGRWAWCSAEDMRAAYPRVEAGRCPRFRAPRVAGGLASISTAPYSPIVFAEVFGKSPRHSPRST